MPRQSFPILLICALWLPAVVAAAPPPSFVNDVVPILTRQGCNQGSCHGKNAGQNGFRLSLRGYAPENDYRWITREFNGRRLETGVPERSLLLTKPTAQAPHQGGKLFDIGSREYQVLLDWIKAGAPGPQKDDARLVKLDLRPGKQTLRVGDTVSLQAEATFSDGSMRDVTWLTRLESNDPGLIAVTPNGEAKMLRHGETAVRASFQTEVAVAVFTIPYDQVVPSERYTVCNNFIDDAVYSKLAALKIEPSDLCGDDEFIRRAFLDAIGTLPTAQEVRAFLADKTSDKRVRLIDALLERPEWVDYWTLILSDLLQNRRERDHDVRGAKGVRSFHNWLRQQVASNRPWDELTRDLLTTKGSTSESPAVGYFIVTVGEHREVERSEVVASVAQAFLGTRIGCAQCHNHPLERYTQDDYYHFAGFLSRVRLERKDPKVGDTALQVSHPDPNQNKSAVGIRQPRTGEFLKPQPLDRSTITIAPDEDPRVKLANWITDPSNEYFSGAMVNRVWRHFLGVGLVEPVDDLRATNPPSNPELWKALNRDFVTHRYDLKHLIRLILNSRTYQLSAATKPGNEADTRFCSHYNARRLPAEVMLDAISQCTGISDEFPGYPKGVRATQLPDPGLKSYFLSLFGRSERVTACACERNGEVTMPQLLHLQNGADIAEKIRSPGGRLAKLLKETKDDSDVLDELFLSTFCRLPTEEERAKVKGWLTRGDGREEVFRDLLWALLNSKVFAFNH
jgi:Protein of unknown function (DUF1549)/Protein of unknown function (DUF1553)